MSEARVYGNWVGGELVLTGEPLDVVNPFTGEAVARGRAAGAELLESAIRASVQGFQAMRALPSWRRAEILTSLREAVRDRRETLARVMTEECGKPITDSRVEVERALNVLALAAEEAKRLGGDVMPLDLLPSSNNRFGITRRFPIGPVAGISPFNFPLNLGLHKVAPALAAGCSIIWKPPLQAPGAAMHFASLCRDAGVPDGAVSVITAWDSDAEILATDERIAMLSFTGSARVGWRLRQAAGRKRVVLELGGNAAAVVAADADIEYAAERCVAGGFAYSGQVCISVQRIYVERSAMEQFLGRLIPASQALKAGDPMDESTRISPLIREADAVRVEKWIREAEAGGAKVLCGGRRNGSFVEPTILTNTRPHMAVTCEEVFGPVVVIEPFDSWDEALALANRSEYGLQTGVFTRLVRRMWQAFETLEVGAVVYNDVPTYRMDSMPYGGVKASGIGREGIRCAIEAMTDERLLVMNMAEQ